MPCVRRAEADAEIILYNNLLASLARKSDPRARASTGRTSRDHCAPPSPSGIARATGASDSVVNRAPRAVQVLASTKRHLDGYLSTIRAHKRAPPLRVMSRALN